MAGSLKLGDGMSFGGAGGHSRASLDTGTIAGTQAITPKVSHENEKFKQNKKLVPGYKDPDVYKAMAKLSGLNPAEVKYQRPDSPGGYYSNKHGGPVSVGQISASPAQ